MGEGEEEHVFPHFGGLFLPFGKKVPLVKFSVFKCYLQGVLSER